MFEPPAGTIGRGDCGDTTGFENAEELVKRCRRIFDMLDDLVRGM
jgi:hypothetical protein